MKHPLPSCKMQYIQKVVPSDESEIPESDSASSTVSKSKKKESSKIKSTGVQKKKEVDESSLLLPFTCAIFTNALKIENQSITIWGVPTSAAQYILV